MMDKLLFLDIETHVCEGWESMSEEQKKAFEGHLWDSDVYDDIVECFNEVAGLHAEFSKVICISIGYEHNDELRLTSILGRDERKLLSQLNETLVYFNRSGFSLVGHNINGFDIPYLAKRYVINGMRVPELINQMGKKPWEVNTVDTMNLWKFGGWNNVSLEVISAALGIKCKSTEISGSNMYRKKIEDIDFNELKLYCEEDVRSCYEIYKRINKYI